MKRSNILSLISFFLMFVILSPTIDRLLDDKDTYMVTIEINEEDNEKDIFLNNLNFSFTEVLLERKNISNSYLLGKYTNSIIVFLRPPKYFI